MFYYVGILRDLYTMFRGLYGNGVLGIPGTVLRSTVSECVSAGRSVTPPECKWTV